MSRILISLIFLIFLLAMGASAQEINTSDVVIPPEWAGTYTAEEIAAIERALYAANLNIEDLNFRKDFTEGYQAFPIVRDWLQHPMNIAPGMDRMIEFRNEIAAEYPSPLAEVFAGLNYYPGLVWAAGEDLPKVAPPQISDINSLVELFSGYASTDIAFALTDEERMIAREFAPENMSWHTVFESIYPEGEREQVEESLEALPDNYLYTLMEKTDFMELANKYVALCPDPRGWIAEIPINEFPVWRPKIIETDMGLIGIGTPYDDKWTGDFVLLIDPGGNDHYKNCRIGAAYGTDGKRYGYFADLGGNDFYDCGDVNITLGAAVMGVAAFYDLGHGNDRYVGGSCTMGASICGIATFYDDGGSDIYEGKVYTQGAAGFGLGIMVDDSVQDAPYIPTDEETADPINIAAFDNDSYSAWVNSQAFARTLGIAICSNERGNENYFAGGVYLHAPLFADRYQSFSQGFAIGERGIDYAGGIALIVDYNGNDRYLGDIYNQGVGYWYSAGLLYDGAGNDNYEMTQYGQGSGIHLAVGGLIDISGHDCYTMHSGLGVGGSHDYAASVLHDRGGGDQYFGNTSCNGSSLTNSAVIFIDRAGNDTYAGRRDGAINFGRPARGFISIGVLIDLAGDDNYLGIMDNGMMWSHSDVGVGWDITPPPPPEDAESERMPGPNQPTENVVMPEIIGYQGELTQEVFDELWAISIRWAVGDNQIIVPAARRRLIEFGPQILPMVSQKFDNMGSGLAIRAFDEILLALVEQDRQGVMDILSENLHSTDQMRVRIALNEIMTLKVMELESDVALMLNDPDPAMQRRAIAVLGALGSHVADDQLLENLAIMDDEALIKVSMETLFQLDVYCWDELRPLLDYPYITVRETLVGLLAANWDKYGQEVLEGIYWQTGLSYSGYIMPDLSTRALRSILKVMRIVEIMPDERLVNAISILLDNDDWGVRADAVWVAHHWVDVAAGPTEEELAAQAEIGTEGEPVEPPVVIDYEAMTELIQPLVEKLDEMRETETEQYVLFVLDTPVYPQ